MNRHVGLKPGKPLKRTQIKRGTSEMKRTEIRKVSKKRQPTNRERERLVARLLKRYPLCERCRQARSKDVHEPRKRSHGADICDPAECVCLCRACHDWAHDNPAEAMAAGWLIDSSDTTTRPRAAAERRAAETAWDEIHRDAA